MTTAATTLLGLALPVTGELSGTWGDTVNNSITSLLDTAVAGTTTLSTDADVTLTTTTLASNQARQAILLCSGARTALRTITAPAQSKIYTIINATTGGYSVKLVGVGPTTGLTIPNGASAVVAWNGSDFIEVGSSTVGNLVVNGTLTVTGATTLQSTLAVTSGATIQGLSVGRGAGAVATNTAVGASALNTNSTGSDTTAIGYQALYSNSTGIQLTAVGSGALYSTTANSSVGVGYQAGYANTTGRITAVGYLSLSSNTTGDYNSGFGRATLGANTTGSYNTAVGVQALTSNTTASNNTAVGYEVGRSNTTGAYNTWVGGLEFNGGLATGRNNTTGNYNTALGGGALAQNTTASNNTAVGYQAGYSNTTATEATYVGTQAGYSVTTGVSNTFIGRQAGYSVTTGYANTFIGGGWSGNNLASGYYVTTGARNTILGNYNGNQGGLDIRTASNYIVLSDGDGNPRMYFNGSGVGYIGISGSGTIESYISSTCGRTNYYNDAAATRSCQYFYYSGVEKGSISISSTATAYNTSSDYRLKEDIQPMTGALAKVAALKPVTYKWKSDGSDGEGFIAHELAEVAPQCVTGEKDAVDAEGNPVYQAIDTSFLVATLTAAIKELKSELDSVKAELATLKGN